MSNRYKIVIFTLDITIPGGIERVVSNFAEYFSNSNDFQIEIVSLFKKNQEIFYNIPDNVKVTYLNQSTFEFKTLYHKIKSHIVLLKSFFQIKKVEGVLFLSTVTNISIYLVLFKWGHKTKIIAAEHSYYFAHGIFARLVRWISYRFVDIVITLTQSDKRLFEPFCKTVYCIPNSLSFFPKEISNCSTKRIIAAGRLVKEKRFDLLLDAYQSLAETFPDWSFNIIGSGFLETILSEKIKKINKVNIKLSPATPYIKEELLKSSIYVCSSETEAFSMILLEAMACGLPIVSFDCPPGPREIIKNEEDGFLVELGNVDSLIEKIRILILDDELRVKYGENARHNVKRFLPENIFAQWSELFKKLSNE